MRGEGSPAGSGSITASAIGLMESVKEHAATMISSIKVSNGKTGARYECIGSGGKGFVGSRI